jgi:hypothetical protein
MRPGGQIGCTKENLTLTELTGSILAVRFVRGPHGANATPPTPKLIEGGRSDDSSTVLSPSRAATKTEMISVFKKGGTGLQIQNFGLPIWSHKKGGRAAKRSWDEIALVVPASMLTAASSRCKPVKQTFARES